MSAATIEGTMYQAYRVLKGLEGLLNPDDLQLSPVEATSVRDLVDTFVEQIGGIETTPEPEVLQLAFREFQSSLCDPSTFGNHVLHVVRKARQKTRSSKKAITSSIFRAQIETIRVYADMARSPERARLFTQLANEADLSNAATADDVRISDRRSPREDQFPAPDNLTPRDAEEE